MKICFSLTAIVQNSDKEKFVYSGYGIAFDGKGSWSFGNNYAGNVVIFGVDNSSSSHTDNQGYDMLLLGEGNTFGNYHKIWCTRKKLVLILVKQRQSVHCNGHSSYLFVNGEEIYKFKANNVNYPTQFCLGSISNTFDLFESKEVCLKGIVHYVSVDYNAIAMGDILDIQKYLMEKNNVI